MAKITDIRMGERPRRRPLRSDNLRGAPSWITPDLVGRILSLSMPVGGEPLPVKTVPMRGVTPELTVIPPSPNPPVASTHSRRTEREAAPQSPTVAASPRITRSTPAAADAEPPSDAYQARADETGTAVTPDAVPAREDVRTDWRTVAAAKRIEANRPLFRIAFERGIAICDLAHALGMPIPTVLQHTGKAGYHFGKRPPLAEPLTRDDLLVLSDSTVPLPELRVDRRRRERKSHCEAEPEVARQAPAEAPSREPAAISPAPRAQPNPERARLDRSHKSRSDAVRRGIVRKAEAMLDAGKTSGEASGVQIKLAMRAVETQRAEEARLGDPIEQAKTTLRRRYAPVCSMAVYDGDPDLFMVGARKNLTRTELLALAARIAA